MGTETEAVVKIRLVQTGNAPQELRGTARAAKEVTDELDRTKRSADNAAKSIQQLANEKVAAIRKQNQVMQAVESRMRSMGMDVHGNQLPAAQSGSRAALGQAGSAVSSTLGMGNLGSLMGGAGAMGPAGIAVAIAGVVVAGIHKGMDVAARVLEASARPHFSEERRRNAMGMELFDVTGIGGKIDRLADAGFAQPRIEANLQKYGPLMAQERASASMMPELMSRQYQAVYARANADAVGQFPLAAMPKFDRSTASGQIAYNEAQRRLAANDQMTMANRRLAGVVVGGEHADRELTTATKEMQSALKEQTDIDRRIMKQKEQENKPYFGSHQGPAGTFVGLVDRGFAGGLLSKAAYRADADTLIRQKELADERVRGAQSGLTKAQELKNYSQSEIAQARNEQRLAQIGGMNAQLDILGDRENRLAGASTRLGGMGMGGRMMGAQAMKFIDQFGVAMATPEILAHAQGFAPMELQKRLEAFGETTPEFQEAKRRGYADFQGGPLKDVRKERDDLTADVRNAMQDSQQTMAHDMANVVNAALKQFVDFFRNEINRILQEQRTGQYQRQNQGN
jgi:hypothetical protein